MRAHVALVGEENRALVLERLHAELEVDHPSVWGKIELLKALAGLEETRGIQRAIQSKVVATRRAAAYLLATDPERREWVGTMAEEWLVDAEAPDREIAATLCGSRKRSAAIPHLFAVLDMDAKDPARAALFREALTALAALNAQGIATVLMDLARSPEVEMTVRGQAFEILARREDGNRGELRRLLLSIAQDGNARAYMRDKTISLLVGKEYADEEVWTVLQGILFDPVLTESKGQSELRTSENWVVQRFAFGSLGRTYPLDRLAELMLDRRLHTHPYYAIRVDVATSLAVLRVRKRRALEILCSFLVDEDPRDTQRRVRQEGWLTLWRFTGVAHGVPDAQIFALPSPAIQDEKFVRQYLFYASLGRIGVTAQQVGAVKAICEDLERMTKIRQNYEREFANIEVDWQALEEATTPAPPTGE